MKQRFFFTLALGVALGSIAACATARGLDYAELAAQGFDVFAGKNWNAPRRNNMYDRWEFGAGGTFRFWHIHHGEPLDRGVWRYELQDGIIAIAKEGTGESAAYAYAFSGKTVTLTPAEQGGGEHGATEHGSSGGHGMGALPEATVTFTAAR
jgi:hypothetical protein